MILNKLLRLRNIAKEERKLKQFLLKIRIRFVINEKKYNVVSTYTSLVHV